MKDKANIFLVGLMGAGKTTVGRQLAAALGHTFYDSDHEIEARTGASIPLIFDVEGEEGFRRREAAVIEELTRQDDIVLATGGGVVLDPVNREHLKSRGTVIYLEASLDKLIQRTARDRNRPLLRTEDPAAKLQALLAARDPLYREVADWVISTDRGNVKRVVRQILSHMKSSPATTPGEPGPGN